MALDPQNNAVNDDHRQWFVMRDLTRSNALRPAYRMLEELGIRCYTPMEWRTTVRKGVRENLRVPVMHDLLFVYATREDLDPIVLKVRTFQYRFLRKTYREPMTVRKDDMERFINAVEGDESARYYRPEEITPEMCNRRIRIVGGRLDGYEGSLVTVRGSKVKRLLVEIPSMLAATVEIEADFVRLV